MGNRLNVFISYRRADSDDFAGRLHDNLVKNYDVFFDTEDGIPSGEKFLKVIVKEIEKADIFLMIVGEESAKEFKDREREGKDDYVTKEIVQAKASSCRIIPVLMNGVNGIEYLPKELEFISELSYYEFAHTKFSLNFQGLTHEVNKTKPKVKEIEKTAFSQEVMDELEKERLVVLFSQDFTEITAHYESIKASVKSKFLDEFYMVSIPSFVDDAEEYFSCVATDCGISCKVKKVSEWNKEMQKKLKSTAKPVLLLITDIQDGNEALDKQFATILRNLQLRFSHFHALFVGRKALATLVYGENELSPLNTAKELFFPEHEMKLGESRITQQFESMMKDKEQICKFLKKERLGRFSTWSYDETLNTLFWKNLLVKEGTHLVWRGEFTKEIARDVLGCNKLNK